MVSLLAKIGGVDGEVVVGCLGGLRGTGTLFVAFWGCWFGSAGVFLYLGVLHLIVPLRWETIKVKLHLHGDHWV